MVDNSQQTKLNDNNNNNNAHNLLAEFDKFYEGTLKSRLLGRYKSENESIRKLAERFEGMFDYNVPHGKKNRGMCVYESVLCMLDSNSLITAATNREELIEQAKALGWCVEFVRYMFTIVGFR